MTFKLAVAGICVYVRMNDNKGRVIVIIIKICLLDNENDMDIAIVLTWPKRENALVVGVQTW